MPVDWSAGLVPPQPIRMPVDVIADALTYSGELPSDMSYTEHLVRYRVDGQSFAVRVIDALHDAGYAIVRSDHA